MSSYCHARKLYKKTSSALFLEVKRRFMEFEKLYEIPPKNPNIQVKVTEMGNVTEVQYMSRRNCKQTIQMLPGGEQFAVVSTGEVQDIQHHETRKDNRKGLYKTFALARALINTNVTDVTKVRWCTLTYAENMTDPKRLYEDFKTFNMRFQRFCKNHGWSSPEYIVMMEPQGRGAWHAHLLYIWEHKAPYISNADFRALWGHGFVKIKKLDNVDNVGAYLTAYLGDMEISECGRDTCGDLKTVEVDEDGKKVRKSIIKGARLDLYPANFNMVRYSRGCKKPTETMMSQEDAQKKVSAATKTFESAVRLSDPNSNFETVIIKEQYNKLRKQSQVY
jgi:hypothetical protein